MAYEEIENPIGLSASMSKSLKGWDRECYRRAFEDIRQLVSVNPYAKLFFNFSFIGLNNHLDRVYMFEVPEDLIFYKPEEYRGLDIKPEVKIYCIAFDYANKDGIKMRSHYYVATGENTDRYGYSPKFFMTVNETWEENNDCSDAGKIVLYSTKLKDIRSEKRTYNVERYTFSNGDTLEDIFTIATKENILCLPMFSRILDDMIHKLKYSNRPKETNACLSSAVTLPGSHFEFGNDTNLDNTRCFRPSHAYPECFSVRMESRSEGYDMVHLVKFREYHIPSENNTIKVGLYESRLLPLNMRYTSTHSGVSEGDIFAVIDVTSSNVPVSQKFRELYQNEEYLSNSGCEPVEELEYEYGERKTTSVCYSNILFLHIPKRDYAMITDKEDCTLQDLFDNSTCYLIHHDLKDHGHVIIAPRLFKNIYTIQPAETFEPWSKGIKAAINNSLYNLGGSGFPSEVTLSKL